MIHLIDAYGSALIQTIAMLRQNAAMQKQRPAAYGYDNADPLEINLVGAKGEYATSLETGLPWHALMEVLKTADGRKLPDVGDNIQVRATERQDGRLIVHPEPKDPPDDRYVLAIVDGWRVDIAGWLWGYEAQRVYWCDPTGKNRPAHFIPRWELHQSAIQP